jgi:hypothetical protein
VLTTFPAGLSIIIIRSPVRFCSLLRFSPSEPLAKFTNTLLMHWAFTRVHFEMRTWVSTCVHRQSHDKGVGMQSEIAGRSLRVKIRLQEHQRRPARRSRLEPGLPAGAGFWADRQKSRILIPIRFSGRGKLAPCSERGSPLPRRRRCRQLTKARRYCGSYDRCCEARPQLQERRPRERCLSNRERRAPRRRRTDDKRTTWPGTMLKTAAPIQTLQPKRLGPPLLLARSMGERLIHFRPKAGSAQKSCERSAELCKKPTSDDRALPHFARGISVDRRQIRRSSFITA